MTLTLTLVSPDPGAPGLIARLRDTRALLASYGLSASTTSPYLVTDTGGHPLVDDHPLYLEMSYLGAGARGIYATVWDAHPGPELAELVYGLAGVGKLLVTPAPAPPHIIVCGDDFEDADVVDESTPPWLEIAVRAQSPGDLDDILNGAWSSRRITYADRYWLD